MPLPQVNVHTIFLSFCRISFVACTLLSAQKGNSQAQICPDNISFSAGDLRNWSATTGLMGGASNNFPLPNIGATSFNEYTISVTGIQMMNGNATDLFGGFPVVPTINGYSYNYSVKMGSTATSWDYRQANGAAGSNPGGFTRAIKYTINVPPGSPSVPYTMTYAYAMVLENGTHNSSEQPLFKAILATDDSVITCASPEYYLPTFNNAGGGGGGSTGATLDTAAALANGFTLSATPFLSHAGQNNTAGTYLYDVWTKGWTEVTFDLSAYRGRQVYLTFEADNCAPGGHFAYAYVAVRNNCGGLEISGNPVVCENKSATFSIPSMAGASYNWTVPAGWTITSGANSNIIQVTAGSTGGFITAHEINGCADLRDTITVNVTPGSRAGTLNGNNQVCTGSNSSMITLSGYRGTILHWLSSTNGTSWSVVPNTSDSYLAQNLTVTTYYKAVVQNGTACGNDTSNAVTITVDPRSQSGTINPAQSFFCLNQTRPQQLSLSGNTGSIVNWQQSPDNSSWNGITPAFTGNPYVVNSISSTQYYRAIVKSGVCPADTSAAAVINFINTPFPDATINPDAAVICYNSTATLLATVQTGTSYSWSPSGSISNNSSGTISGLPYTINTTARPLTSVNYVLSVINAGCPNPLLDTFHVTVRPKIVVFAGNDTNVVANQPLQLRATVNDPTATNFNWTPPTGLNFTNIPAPIAVLNTSMGNSILYTVKATNPDGCSGEDDIKVTIFKTGPDLFVPAAFTPNGDGLNDRIYPICVGISKLDYFRVFNRWGQLVFSTSQIGQGWDGKIGGLPQQTDTFVFIAQGVDYTGRVIFRKGTVNLIR